MIFERRNMARFFAFAAVIMLLLSIYVFFILRRAAKFWGINVKNRLVNIIIIGLSLLICALGINPFRTPALIILHIIGISAVLELINLFVFIAKKIKPFSFKAWNAVYKSGITPIVVTAVLLVYGFINMHNLVETDYTVTTKKNISQDYKVLMLADSHYGTTTDADDLKEIKSRAEKQELDLVVLVGDIVDESTTNEGMRESFKILGDIKSKYGTYYVFGNHDKATYTSDPNFTESELRQVIEQNGITILEDENVQITDDLVIAGRQDFSDGRASVDTALNGVDKDDFIIMLDHQPRDYEEEKQNQTDIVLSGHTHAGQIWPAKYVIDLFNMAELSYGIETNDDFTAVVTSGVSGWGYPIRTQEHSEFVIIDIKKA